VTICGPPPTEVDDASGKREKNLVDLGSLRMLISLDKPTKPGKLLILYLVCLNELVVKHEHEPKQGHKHAKGLKPLKRVNKQ
jgi:hypothetical protein